MTQRDGHFERAGWIPEDPALGEGARKSELLDALQRVVLDRFARLSGQIAVLHVFDASRPRDRATGSLRVRHPVCRQYPVSDTCCTSWQQHLGALERSAGIHWHRCPREHLCALVPVVHEKRCVAACQLVCSDPTDEAAFHRDVELLDVLVDHFTASYRDVMGRLGSNGDAPAVSCFDRVPTETEAATAACHPQVRRAMDHVEKHITDTGLTVARVARDIGSNPTYLAHLFREEIGVRMSRYIAHRRIDLAKRLLSTTPWQIKRIAYESGHANADWFSHVFQVHTGMTPTDYRRENSGR